MYLAFVMLLSFACVAHLYVLFIMHQGSSFTAISIFLSGINHKTDTVKNMIPDIIGLTNMLWVSLTGITVMNLFLSNPLASPAF